MSGSDAPSDTWTSLIIHFASRLTSPNEEPITSEDQFREAFTALCTRYKEIEIQRLLTRVRRQHGSIISFASAIDATNRFEPPACLGTLVWQLLTRAIHVAFEAKKQLPEFVKETQKLNAEVPPLNREQLTRFAYEPKVQKPLQDFLKEYMNCYLSMFSDFATFPCALRLDRFDQRVQHVKEFFRQRTVEWEAALKLAEAEEQRLMLSASVPSLLNGVMGEQLHPHGTNAHFRFVAELGTGTYGEVSVVVEPTSKTFYAQKSIRIRDRHDARAKEVIEQQVKNEVTIMQRLRHHHIASVLFYVRDVSAFSLIMLPVADYDLRQFLEDKCIQAKYPSNELKQIDNWFGCLVSALAYAHEQQIKHEDIKPSNILIKEYRPYLADFGSAKDFSHLETSASTAQMIAGTPVYWPPEINRSRGRPVDVFALGCVFSEMLTVRQKRSLSEYRNERFVPDTDFGFAFRKNLPGVERWLKALPNMDDKETVQHFLLDIVLKMLEKEPDARLTAKQIRKRLRAEEDILFCSSC